MNQFIKSTCKTTNENINSCGSCRLAGICLPLSLHIDDINKLDSLIQKSQLLQRGDYLYKAGDAFTSIYAIRAGAIKTWASSPEGNDQVTGFYLPGEVIGLDGVADAIYTNSAQALQTTAVCAIPFTQLEQLTLEIPKLQHHVFQLMSREIRHDQNLLSLLGKTSAESRVASLILSVSSRHDARDLSPKFFSLPMSRSDIGNFLGLTLETVSRIFSRLQKQSIIVSDKKDITILDFEALRFLTLAKKGKT